jgi:hypothetical protein
MAERWGSLHPQQASIDAHYPRSKERGKTKSKLSKHNSNS